MTLSFRIKKSSDFVFEYLSDMQKFASVHPLITKIDRIVDDHFLVHETLKIGLIPISFTYPVAVSCDPTSRSVAMRATVMKLTVIEITFALKADQDFTIIEEHVAFTSPFPIQSIMERVFKKQHSQLFKNMEMA